MPFSALHRLLGRPPGAVTDELLAEAVNKGLAETDDLDWKSKLPPLNGLPSTDFPKDIAAMANSGGGTIVYGVDESAKAATGWRDIGELDERYESALRSAAVTAITPPIFGLEVFRLKKERDRAVAIVIPASTDGPHLIYKGEYFGAPIRNDADTVWMKERQIEAMYRARFDDQRRSTEALSTMYEEAASSWPIPGHAQFVAVARPRVPVLNTRMTRDSATSMAKLAESNTLTWSESAGVHPLVNVDRYNPRPGYRRWVLPNSATNQNSSWKTAWAAFHDDGSVSVTSSVGGHRRATGLLAGSLIDSAAIEVAVSDFMALVRAQAIVHGLGEFEVRVGIEWNGANDIVIFTIDNFGARMEDHSIPLPRFVPVTTTVDAGAKPLTFHFQVHDLAEDCINQGGIASTRMIKQPDLEA